LLNLVETCEFTRLLTAKLKLYLDGKANLSNAYPQLVHILNKPVDKISLEKNLIAKKKVKCELLYIRINSSQ